MGRWPVGVTREPQCASCVHSPTARCVAVQDLISPL